MEKSYSINKNKKKTKVSINVDNIKGYKVTPKNKIHYDGTKVKEMLLINPNFIDAIIKKKTTKKLESYLEYVINIVIDEDTDDSDTIIQIIYDLKRYKNIIKRKYRKYLDPKYLDQLLAKIELLEGELSIKLEQIEYKIQKEIEAITR